MRTLNLREAAEFLHLHPEELRQRAKAGRIPGAKVGRAWVFLEDDLASHVRSLYGSPRQALQVTPRMDVTCHYTGTRGSGGSPLPTSVDSEYADLLGLPKRPSRKNSTTS